MSNKASREKTPHAAPAKSPAARPRDRDPSAELEITLGNQGALAFLSRNSGAPLDNGTRDKFEGWMGKDLAEVRVHDGDDAASAARSVHARAFTVGENVAFADGAYAPGTTEGDRLLAHELTHVVQRSAVGITSGATTPLSHPADTAEHEADRVAGAFTRGEPSPAIVSPAAAVVAREGDEPDVDDPDHATQPAPPPAADPVLAPLADDAAFDVTIDTWDPATFWTPPGTTRREIAMRLYGDPERAFGFDIIGDKHVRMRSFEGVTAEDVVTSMRTALDARSTRDVGTVVGILCQHLIGDADERTLRDQTVWWSNRSELTDAGTMGYLEHFLGELDTHNLTESGVFSDTTQTGSQWLLTELEEKQADVLPLLMHRTSRGAAVASMFGLSASTGPLEAGAEVGTYSYRQKRAPAAIGEWDRGTRSITVRTRVVDEASAAAAEIALRNMSPATPRLLVPGGDGHFYGYTLAFPFFEEGHVEREDDPHLDDYWWHRPGSVFVQPGEFRPDFGTGGAEEHAQRAGILERALAASGAEALRGLDFDVLSTMTLAQRVDAITRARAGGDAADASLVARILYATPSAEFPALERTLSADGTLAALATMGWPQGALATIGRIFTVKSLESMQVAGEDLASLPELRVGVDDDGYFHYGVATGANAASRALSAEDFGAGGTVSLGHERALAGEASHDITRSVLTIQPAVFRLGGLGVGGLLVNTYRGMAQTLMVNDGASVGPLLPTQLVRVTTLGPGGGTRIVTAFEAAGILDLPSNDILGRMVSTITHGGAVLLGTMGLAEAFGPALLEGLAEGGGARAIAGAMGDAAVTEGGAAALQNAALIGGMEAVDRNRAALAAAPGGRAFLEIYDVTMMIWMSHDIARLVSSGLVPRLTAAADEIIARGGALRDALMPFRDELEAMRRAIARSTMLGEARELAVIDGPAIIGGAEEGQGFFQALRVSRGEVASEQLLGRVAGTDAQPVARRVLGRLEGAIDRSQLEVASAAQGSEELRLASQRARSAANARLAVAQRAAQLRPEARDAFLRSVDAVISARPNAIGSLTDLITAAAASARPNVFMAEVQRLVARPGLSSEALAVLGPKVRRGVLDLEWLNGTSLTDEALDFLARDSNTPWSLYRRAALNPDGSLMRGFRTVARGAGAEMVAAGEAARLGTATRRQVRMGSSEIDFEVIINGRARGLEVKGWTVDTWDAALDAAMTRRARRAMTDAERQAVRKIDTLIRQLQDARTHTGAAPMLALTDALSAASRARLRLVLNANGLATTEFVNLSEAAIKETAATTIGVAVGVPHPAGP